MDRKETNMTEPNPWQAHKQGDTMKHRILGMATALITAMMLIGGGGGRNSRSRNTH